jgi:ketosteroid isomerase-like protein
MILGINPRWLRWPVRAARLGCQHPACGILCPGTEPPGREGIRMMDPQVIDQIKAAMLRYDNAYREGDLEGLRRIRHPDFVFTSSRGQRFTNKEELAALSEGISRIEELEVHDSRVHRVIGDTAIVLYRAHLAGIWYGTPFSGEFALTMTWVKTGSEWLVLTDHSSAIQG